MFLSTLCGNDEEESVKVGHANHFAVVRKTFLEDAVKEHWCQRTSAISGEKRKHHENKLTKTKTNTVYLILADLEATLIQTKYKSLTCRPPKYIQFSYVEKK